ncbi:hypothetical protein M5K25_019412 [Dendrobium thyrsiflorum]|uniref:Receptor-like serine/threonine-protein kinase n=1 Tax=Dendrobium thyrsiflorum TaxID=117978 RepID=A0ABD0UFA8_DENTH
MKNIGSPFFLLASLLLAFLPSSTARDSITPITPLSGDQTLVSSTKLFALGFFTPAGTANSYLGIWYNNIKTQTIVWVANRNSPVAGNSTDAILSISRNGNLIITDRNSNSPVWSSLATSSLATPLAQLLDNGNFVVRNVASGDNDFAWQSFDHPTDTLIPGMKIGVNFDTRINRTVAAWTSDTDPSSSSYTAAMDTNGDPQLYFWSGLKKIWRSGPWDGLHFSGVPETTTYGQFNLSFSFINTKNEVSYSFNNHNSSIVTRLLLNQSGHVQRAIWLWDTERWNFFWQAPGDQCDNYAACGPYGICDPNMSPVCECVQGFTPRNPTNWALMEGKDGCRRKTTLDCRNGTDGFVTVSGAKVPDTAQAVVDFSLGLDGCKTRCLMNCSCTAYALANLSSGSGCLMWVADLVDIRLYTIGGQDVYVRVAAADLGSDEHNHTSELTAVIVPSIVGVVFLLAGVGWCMWRRKNKRRRMLRTSSFHDKRCAEQEQIDNDFELPIFPLEIITAATNNFSAENKLGEGGFGPVYKGRLDDGHEIAVKRLAKTSVQGLDEFKTEVMLIAKLQHRNLVRLLGCCVQGRERMLVYEYLPNKSLDAFLFDKAKSVLLNWQTRYEIIFGISRGLLYLHQDSRLRIIHRDLKASNILLDEEMNPKISDFGMARIFGGDETQVNTMKVVGTYGYMSPEYAMDGVFSVKSDVFSFGVLVLEIISGKRNRGVYSASPHMNLLGHVWSLWKEGNSLKLSDETMNSDFSVDEVLKCIKIGLLCVQERPEDRPLMSWIVLMLASDSGLGLPEPKEPGFFSRFPVDSDSSSGKQESTTINYDLSVSIIEGR